MWNIACTCNALQVKRSFYLSICAQWRHSTLFQVYLKISINIAFRHMTVMLSYYMLIVTFDSLVASFWLQRKAIRIIGDFKLTDTLEPLSQRRDIRSLRVLPQRGILQQAFGLHVGFEILPSLFPAHHISSSTHHRTLDFSNDLFLKIVSSSYLRGMAWATTQSFSAYLRLGPLR